MRQLARELLAEFAVAAAVVAGLAVAAWLLWRKLNAPTAGGANLAEASKNVLTGGLSAIGSAIRGESESGYVSQDEFRKASAAALAAKLANAGVR